MSWNAPKTNWKAGDTPNSGDFNRIEGNIGLTKDILDVQVDRKATKTALGQVIIGNGINVDSNGKISTQEIEMFEEVRLYCNSSTGNDNNDGRSSSKAFKTLSKAVNVAKKIIANKIIISLSVGTYTGVKLTGILANQIDITGDYSNPESTIVDGNISTEDMHGKLVRIMHFKLNGEVGAINQPSDLNCLYMTINGSVGISGGNNLVKINSSKITNSEYGGISISNCGIVEIDNCTLIGAHSCIYLSNVGSAKINSNTITLTKNTSHIASINIANATTATISSLKGSTGSSAILRSSESVVFYESGQDITGGANKKENGGQIFS